MKTVLDGLPAGRLIPTTSAANQFDVTLISQGGLSIAIAVSALLMLGTTLEDPSTAGLMFDVVVLGVMANELMGPPLLKRVLAAGDELVDAG